jgi:Flp pilus assembly protein TadD
VTRIRLNQVEEARHLFDRAILANEGSGRAHFMHGVASFHLDDTEAAVRSLKRAMELEADHAEWASFLGVVHVVRGEWEQAVEALGLAVDLEPRQATAHYNLSYALLNGEQSDAKRALKHYQLALKHGLSPNERMENYFRKLQGLGDAEAALEAPAS